MRRAVPAPTRGFERSKDWNSEFPMRYSETDPGKIIIRILDQRLDVPHPTAEPVA